MPSSAFGVCVFINKKITLFIHRDTVFYKNSLAIKIFIGRAEVASMSSFQTLFDALKNVELHIKAGMWFSLAFGIAINLLQTKNVYLSIRVKKSRSGSRRTPAHVLRDIIFIGCRTWIRTKMNGFRVHYPTIR